MIKCGVCGSENEAAALFCGVCGSPLGPAEARDIADEAARRTGTETTPTDESVVPGKGGARRDLGTGGQTGTGSTTEPTPRGADAEPVTTDTSVETGGPTIVCSVCGTVNDAARTYCRKCANELKPMAGPPPPPPPPPNGRRISPVAIGLAAAGVVLAVGAIAILVSGGIGPGASPTASAQGSPAASDAVQTPRPTDGRPTDSPFDEGDPDGRIVFARCIPDGDCVLFMIDADGTEIGRLTSPGEVGSATDPGFAHDGNRVAFSTPDGLRILDIDSGEITDHSSGSEDANADWSPDDSRLTFSGSPRVREDPGGQNEDREIRLDGVTVTGPSEPLTQNAIEDHDPVFTPDG
ncbi:MAG: hypothetical protein L0221_11920, partial [Chloroflexi bacterium]|nr:hypothetical protein [Chloroflexota bacterium]